MLWTAPELLYKRQAGLNTRKAVQGTQSGDIYSFAIILQEILYRALPYQATGEQTMVTKGELDQWLQLIVVVIVILFLAHEHKAAGNRHWPQDRQVTKYGK